MKGLLAALFLPAFAVGQEYVVVPASAESADGNAHIGVAGVGFSESQQIILDASHLQPMLNRTITAIQFRRDRAISESLAGGSATLAVRIGVSPHSPAEAVPTFAVNLPVPSHVFSGAVVVPAAPAPAMSGAWDADQSVRVAFATPFVYTGGHLCIEVVGAIAGIEWWWPADAVFDPVTGSVSQVGVACGSFALPGGVASVAPGDLIPGETATFMYRGTPGAAVLLSIGATLFPQPLDLSIVGAPGCAWSVDPIAFVPSLVGAALPVSELGGFANVAVHLPSVPALLGSSFVSQWLEVSSPLAVSEALICQFSTTLPSLGMALVFAEPGATAPTVELSTAPVVRFELQ